MEELPPRFPAQKYRADQWKGSEERNTPNNAVQGPIEEIADGAYHPRHNWCAFNKARSGVGRTDDNMAK